MQERYSYYADEPSLSCSYRQGLSNKLTVGAYAQAFSQGVGRGTFSQGIESGTFLQDSSGEPSIRCALMGGDALYAISNGTIELDAAGSYGKGRGPDFAARLTYNYVSRLFSNPEPNGRNPLRLNAPISWTTRAEYLGPNFFNNPREYQYTSDREALDLSTALTMPLANQVNISATGTFYVRRDTSNFADIALSASKTWLRNLRANVSLGFSSEVYSTRANPYTAAGLFLSRESRA